jgi:hypothetical protein
MSYRILKHAGLYGDCITLKGEGEHEGTNLTFTGRDLQKAPVGNERELAEYLDRRFLLAHHDLLAAPFLPDVTEKEKGE